MMSVVRQSITQQLTTAIQDCYNRGCTSEQIKAFIHRARGQHKGSQEVLALLDDMEVRYVTSLDGGEERP